MVGPGQGAGSSEPISILTVLKSRTVHTCGFGCNEALDEGARGNFAADRGRIDITRGPAGKLHGEAFPAVVGREMNAFMDGLPKAK